MNKLFSIRVKLLLAFLLVSIVPIVFLTSLFVSNGHKLATERALEEVKLITEFVELNVDSFLNLRSVRVADWASDGYIRSEFEQILLERQNDEVEDKEARKNKIAEYLINNKLSLDSEVLFTEIFDKNGLVVISTNKSRMGMKIPSDVAEQEFRLNEAIQGQFGETFSSKLFIMMMGVDNTMPMYHVVTPLYSHDFEVIGVMVNHVDLKSLEGVISLTQFDENPISSVLKDFEIHVIEDETFSTLVSTNKENLKISTPLFGKELYNKCRNSSGEYLERFINHHGVEVIGGLGCSRSDDWSVLVEIPFESTMAAFQLFLRNAIIFSFILLVLVSIGAWVFSNKIRKNIYINLDAIRKIAAGSKDVKILKISNDEIGEVAEGINEMSEKLFNSEKRKEELLRRTTVSETKFKRLIESSPDCIQLLDLKGRIVTLNRSGLEEHGFSSEEEAKGWNYMDAIERKYIPAVKNAFARAKAGETVTEEIKHTKEEVGGKSNREWCNLTLSPVIGQSGSVENILVVSRDITGQKEDQKKMSDLHTMKSRLMSVLSHQLRTPLSAIRWNLETLLSGSFGELTPEQKSFVQSIYSAETYLIKRINDVLISIDIEEDRISFVSSNVDLNSIIVSAISTVSPRAEARSIKVSFDVMGEFDSNVLIDPTRTSLAITHIIENAVDFSKEEGEVKISLEQKDGYFRIDVVDNGIGIPASDQKNIFRKFFRAMNAFTSKPDGSGLGLSIAKYMIEKQGGKLTFVSKEGKGSTFSIDIQAD